MEGIGSNPLWGLSPALDLGAEVPTRDSLKQMGESLKASTESPKPSPEESNQRTDSIQEPHNVLVMGAGDARHLLRTMAMAQRSGRSAVNFYVVEGQMPLIARQLLQLDILLDRTCDLSFSGASWCLYAFRCLHV